MTNDTQEDIIDPINNEEETVEEELPVEETPEAPQEGEVPAEKPVETPEDKVARLKRQLKQAEKQAGIVEPKQQQPKKEAPQGLSLRDTTAIIKANIHEDDIADVEDYAKFKGISVAEALKTNAVKAILTDKEEQRTIATATNISSSRRTSKSASGEDLVKNMEKGKMPDINDIDKAADAIMQNKINSNKK